jgi:hypothetical protein
LRFWLFHILVFAISSCSLFSNEEEPEVKASVYGKELYISDLNRSIPNGLDSLDSAVMAEGIIDAWLTKQVLVKQAENNLTTDLEEIDRKLEEYRSDLLIYAYQKEFINQNLDTVVNEEEISAYYEENRADFLLKDIILKVRYIKLDTNAPSILKAEQWLMSNNPEDVEELEDYCYQYAVNFYLDEQNWLYLDDFLKELPLTGSQRSQLLKTGKLIRLADPLYIYLIRVLDYKLKDAISPLSLEKDNIRNTIINERRIQLLEEMEADLYNNALRDNEIKIY